MYIREHVKRIQFIAAEVSFYVRDKSIDLYSRVRKLKLFRRKRVKAEVTPLGTFRRGMLLTIVGLMHVLLGFFSTTFSIIRMGVIGIGEPFRFSTAIGVYNVMFELTPIILWISGIGLLRAKKWGYILGSSWAILALFFHISAYIMRRVYWGDFAAVPGWGEYIIMYYAVGFIAVSVYVLKRKPV
jgi:hypothetical protein